MSLSLPIFPDVRRTLLHWKQALLSESDSYLKQTLYKKDEIATGGVWIDMKPIYRKVIEVGALPNATTKDVDHDIPTMDTIVDFWGTATRASAAGGTTCITIGIPHADTGSTNLVEVQILVDKVRLVTAADYSAYDGFVVIEYTK